MAILKPEHLFDQADKLSSPPPAGSPRQVDIRRAISAAYDGIFHATITAAADQFVGVTKRSTSQYGLVYQSVDHGALRTLCEEVKKPSLSAKYAPSAFIAAPVASHPVAGPFGDVGDARSFPRSPANPHCMIGHDRG